MESEASVKTSYENKCLYSGTWCVLPRAGMRDHALRGATGVPGHALQVPSEHGSDPELCTPGDHHLPSKAVPQVKEEDLRHGN